MLGRIAIRGYATFYFMLGSFTSSLAKWLVVVLARFFRIYRTMLGYLIFSKIRHLIYGLPHHLNISGDTLSSDDH